jgi:4-hydroxy-3-methylbut-2-enyl diphosphate reductase
MLCAEKVLTFHIEDSSSINVADGSIHHRSIGLHHAEEHSKGWLPAGRLRVGLTAGASTPNNKIGETVAALLEMRGVPLESVLTP